MREYIKSNTNDKGASLSLSLLSLQPHESTAAAGQTICAWQCGWHSPNEGAASEDDEKRPASHLDGEAHFINVTQRTHSATTYASIDVIHISKPRLLLLLLLLSPIHVLLIHKTRPQDWVGESCCISNYVGGKERRVNRYRATTERNKHSIYLYFMNI